MNELRLTFSYTNTDFTRQYIIKDVEITSTEAKNRVQTFNASIASDSDLKGFFISDDYESPNKGLLNSIVEAKYVKITETDIPLA